MRTKNLNGFLITLTNVIQWNLCNMDTLKLTKSVLCPISSSRSVNPNLQVSGLLHPEEIFIALNKGEKFNLSEA